MRGILWSALILMGGIAYGADTTVVVMDASGSMDELVRLKTGERMEKIKVAKMAMLKTLMELPEDHNLGILVFSARNLSSDQEWIYPVGPVDRKKLAAAIQRPSPGGGTPLGEYMKLGADVLLEQREKHKGYGTYNLILVTDGMANDGALVDRNLPLIRARGIQVNVIGLAMEPDDTLAQRVTSYQNADDIESLSMALKKAVAEVPTGQNGMIDPAWFDEIEPLPHEVASAAIVSMTSSLSQNQPIGVAPKVVTDIDEEGTVIQIQNPTTEQSGPQDNRLYSLFRVMVLAFVAILSGLLILLIVVMMIRLSGDAACR